MADLYLLDRSPYGPSLEELRAMLPPGGRVGEAPVVNGVDEPAYLLNLRRHKDKIPLLDALSWFDAGDARVRRVAEYLTAPTLGDSALAVEALHRTVRDGVQFVAEPVETFQHTLRTLETCRGDCDDSARALVALARSLGIEARLATLGSPPRHVFAMLSHRDRGWVCAETTLAAELGEHPLAAHARIGGVERIDLG